MRDNAVERSPVICNRTFSLKQVAVSDQQPEGLFECRYERPSICDQVSVAASTFEGDQQTFLLDDASLKLANSLLGEFDARGQFFA